MRNTPASSRGAQGGRPGKHRNHDGYRRRRAGEELGVSTCGEEEKQRQGLEVEERGLGRWRRPEQPAPRYSYSLLFFDPLSLSVLRFIRLLQHSPQAYTAHSGPNTFTLRRFTLCGRTAASSSDSPSTSLSARPTPWLLELTFPRS
jgi:hypothetical protein